MLIQRGFRGKMMQNFDLSQNICADIAVDGPAAYDFSCFGIDENDKLSDDRYMIFYNQPASPEKAILADLKDHHAHFSISLHNIPTFIKKLVFTVSLDGIGTMQEMKGCNMTLKQGSRQPLELSLSGQDFQKEKAIIVMELYLKDEWRINAVARGYNGGLADLLKSFGGEAAAPQAPAPATPKPVHPEQPAMKKVELKKGQKVNLQKSNTSPLGEIMINLNWNTSKAKSKGFFSAFTGNEAIDLDLGCLYELSNGAKGVVQALGNCFGVYDWDPYIALDSDDRTGTSTAGETMRINGKEIARFKRILIFAFIYDGIANWKQADGLVTVRCPGSPDIVVRMDAYDTSKPMCAIAMLENINNTTFSVEKIVDFYRGHKEMDRAFHWGMNWVHGSK